MKALVVYSSKNVKGKHDATGAFSPYSLRFCRHHGFDEQLRFGINAVGTRKALRREQLLELIDMAGKDGKIDLLALFCHGWPSGLQFGLNRKNIPELADVIADNCARDLKIVLYACSAAENDVRDREYDKVGPGTDNGYADQLRDAISERGITDGWVDGHKTAGDAIYNPFVVRFNCRTERPTEHPELFRGGAWIVQPRSELWPRWRRAMREGMQFDFPVASKVEILREIIAGRS